jgi:hypothetical protein
MSTSRTPQITMPSSLEQEILRQDHAFMALRTESGDQPWSKYRLSNAGGKSGYSFGQIQVDLAVNNEEYRKDFASAATSWLLKNGKITGEIEKDWKNKIIEQLAVPVSAGKLTSVNKDLLNSFLASPEGHRFADATSAKAFDKLIMPRLAKFFSKPSARLLIKDPQFIAYAAKIANASEGVELQKFLNGDLVELGGEPVMPEGRSKIMSPMALDRAFVGKLQKPGQVMIKGEAKTLAQGIKITVSRDGFFVEGERIDLLDESLSLSIPDDPKTRPRFHENGRAMGIDTDETNKRFKSEVILFKKEQKSNNKELLLDFKDAAVFPYNTLQITKEQATGKKPLFPGEFYQLYAKNNAFAEPLRKGRDDIYVKNAWQYQYAETRPEVLAEVDDALWDVLDPQGVFLPNLRQVVQAQHEFETQQRLEKKQVPRPLNREVLREYMFGNQRVMAEAVRTQPPKPKETQTQAIYYPDANGNQASLTYKVDPELLQNDQVGLARAFREKRYWDIRIAPNKQPLPSPFLDIDPSQRRKSGERASLIEKPSKFIFKGNPVVPQTPVILAMAPLALPGAGGPAPFARPPGPSTAEQLAQAADEQRAAEVAAFEEEERLGKLVRGEIERYARRPRHGWTPFEEAVLCGATIHNPNGYRHRDFGGPFG